MRALFPFGRENFYPRPPRGGRHCTFLAARFRLTISIHALREEGDQRFRYLFLCLVHFYPRPPRGGRLYRLFV